MLQFTMDSVLAQPLVLLHAISQHFFVMLKNYFLIGLRNILRHKTFSFINITGLALSMSVGLLIISMIAGLSRYDDFHEKSDRIYRVLSKSTGKSTCNATSPMPLRHELTNEYEGIEKVVTFKMGFGGDASYNDLAVPLVGYFCSEELFDVFGFQLQSGNPASALAGPHSVVLTSESAKKIFGDEEALGKVIRFSERGLVMEGIPNKNKPTSLGDYTVTGVLEELPGKTHLDFHLLASLSTLSTLEKQGLEHTLADDWKNNEVSYQYVLMKEGFDEHYLQGSLDDISNRKRVAATDFSVYYKTQPLDKITPGKLYGNPFSFRLPMQVIYFFMVLALIVLLSACINYTNLSLAKSLNRALEVGIRKTAGASRFQVFGQFIGESVFVSTLSLIIAIVLLRLLEPALMGLWLTKYIKIDFATDMQVILIFLGFSTLVGIVAGIIPALYVSRFRPIQVLKKLSISRSSKRMSMRKVLVTIQFAMSLFFIMTTLAVYFQLNFLLDSEYGFNKNGIINVSLQGNEYRQFANAIKDHSGITGVSGSSVVLAAGGTGYTVLKNPVDVTDSLGMSSMSADSYFFENHEITFAAGESFPTEGGSAHSLHVILNREAAVQLGFDNPHEIIGESFVEANKGNLLNVVGVVENFHFSDLTQHIGPFAMVNRPDDFRYANLRMSPDKEEAAMEFVRKEWKAMDNDHVFEAESMSSRIAETHMIFSDISYIVGFISILAISIACLGLLGMVIYITQNRVKEVGIRKVFGADLRSLIISLSKGFVVMLVIALVIAAPLATYINELWLQQFAVRIQVGVEIIGISVFIILLLGAITIFYNTVKVAKSNTADVLRYE